MRKLNALAPPCQVPFEGHRMQEGDAITKGRPNAKPYKPNDWATFHVPLDGEFLKAVKALAGEEL